MLALWPKKQNDVRDKVGRENDVHFAPEGYDLLAKAVAASIETQLPKK